MVLCNCLTLSAQRQYKKYFMTFWYIFHKRAAKTIESDHWDSFVKP